MLRRHNGYACASLTPKVPMNMILIAEKFQNYSMQSEFLNLSLDYFSVFVVVVVRRRSRRSTSVGYCSRCGALFYFYSSNSFSICSKCVARNKKKYTNQPNLQITPILQILRLYWQQSYCSRF